MALEAGDNDTVQDAFTKIYNFIEKYVYKTLWDNYRTLMQNKYHREDIIQEVWLRIFSELKIITRKKGLLLHLLRLGLGMWCLTMQAKILEKLQCITQTR